MRRQRHHLFLAAAMASAIGSVALAEHASPTPDATATHVSQTRQAAVGTSGLQVGSRLDETSLHAVTRPGLYGMSQPPAGSRYGIVDGLLIRYDPDSDQVLSIIRQVDQILD